MLRAPWPFGRRMSQKICSRFDTFENSRSQLARGSLVRLGVWWLQSATHCTDLPVGTLGRREGSYGVGVDVPHACILWLSVLWIDLTMPFCVRRHIVYSLVLTMRVWHCSRMCSSYAHTLEVPVAPCFALLYRPNCGARGPKLGWYDCGSTGPPCACLSSVHIMF